jgi:hypothetical protein
MAVVKFTARQRDHLVPTLVCAIQFTLGTTCLTVNISNFLATLFRQLLTLALMSLMIRVTRFLLLIKMQKPLGVSTRNIFQRNLHIDTRSFLSYSPVGICRNLRITTQLFALPAGWHPSQFAHCCVQLFELPAGWHPL